MHHKVNRKHAEKQHVCVTAIRIQNETTILMCSTIYSQRIIYTEIFNSFIPVPNMNTSQSVRMCFFSGIVILTDFPMALRSHTNSFHTTVDMSLQDDPHFLDVPLYGPTMIRKFRRRSPGER